MQPASVSAAAAAPAIGTNPRAASLSFTSKFNMMRPNSTSFPWFWLAMDELSSCLNRPILYHSLPVGVAEGSMRRNALSTSLWLVAIFITFAAGTVQAAELIWQLENPFRFFKSTNSFAMHEAAYNGVRGAANGPLPVDIVWRLERRLNDPDCKDASTPDRCAETAGPGYAQSRLGWAAQTLGDTCYEVEGLPRRYAPLCAVKNSWSSTKEDYSRP